MKTISFPTWLTPGERAALTLFFKQLAENGIYPEEVYLFGSRARMEGDEHSDIDVAIIGNGLKLKPLIELALDVKETTGIDISPAPFTKDEFSKGVGLSGRVKEEGIRLW